MCDVCLLHLNKFNIKKRPLKWPLLTLSKSYINNNRVYGLTYNMLLFTNGTNIIMPAFYGTIVYTLRFEIPATFTKCKMRLLCDGCH